jgi:hypothetical protein
MVVAVTKADCEHKLATEDSNVCKPEKLTD